MKNIKIIANSMLFTSMILGAVPTLFAMVCRTSTYNNSDSGWGSVILQWMAIGAFMGLMIGTYIVKENRQ